MVILSIYLKQRLLSGLINLMSSFNFKKARKHLPDEERLVWIDLEGPNLIVHQPDGILDGMNRWCQDHHGKSGLTEASRNSTLSLQAAEMALLSFVRQHTPPGKCPLAGNSVHEDKKFLDKYMPELMRHLHYRIVDVSTIKELCRRWYPEDYKIGPKKTPTHRALEDITESINELRYYRKAIFK
ncbi:oligoribonuclease, mitochondrial isoform X2 [Tachypleus tridentatus]|uniref:oligoribonuclease, mitochondrial isoform X2 n=1 Tax=Tachypleus tridentatus TaxID=6853 RepID=UPI003FCF2F00